MQDHSSEVGGIFRRIPVHHEQVTPISELNPWP